MILFEKNSDEQKSVNSLQTETPKGLKRSKKQNIIVFLLFGLILFFLGLFVYFRYQNNFYYPSPLPTSSSKLIQTSPLPPISLTPSLSPDQINKKAYLGLSFGKRYVLVDFESGAMKEFLPAGYKLASYYYHVQFPENFFLEKDKEFFLFSLKDQKLSNLSKLFPELNVAKDEDFIVAPSISEKNKFYLSIIKFEEIQGETLGVRRPISTRSYFFDASLNKIERSRIGNFEDCYVYDSKNRRFFTWKCGEGIGNSVPLYLQDLEGNKLELLVSLNDYGYSDENLGFVDVSFNGGYIIVVDSMNFSKITVINTLAEKIVKEVYQLNPSLKLEETQFYSAAIDKQNKVIIIGSNDKIVFLKYDNQNRITESKILPEKNAYANFLFLHQGKLIYSIPANDDSQNFLKNLLVIVNLANFQREKTIPLGANLEEEITLISI